VGKLKRPKKVAAKSKSTGVELKADKVESPTSTNGSVPAIGSGLNLDYTDSAKGTGDRLTETPPGDVIVTTASASENHENHPRVESIKAPTEAKNLIIEKSLPSMPVQFEQTRSEVKKLIAGRDYDTRVINAKDSATRQIVAAELLSTLTSRNYD